MVSQEILMDDSRPTQIQPRIKMLFMRGEKVAHSLSTRKKTFQQTHQLLTNVQLLLGTASITALSPVNTGRPLLKQLERLPWHRI
jgi:hypothetical protein